MKKALLGVLLCLSMSVFAFSGGFSIKVNGGANFLMGGDYNKIVDGINDYWHSIAGVTIAGGVDKLSMGWNFGAEFIYNITDQMGVGLGVGYLMASNESTITATSGGVALGGTFSPSVSAIPITLNFHYFMPVGDTMNIHFTAGPGLYISSLKWDIAETLGTTADPTLGWDLLQTFEPDGVMGFGFQGGLGIEFALSPSISLCLDVLGRMASLSGFSGPWTLTGLVLHTIPVSDSGTGTFYYYEDGGFADFTIDTSAPSWSGITNVREASVSLSGVVAQFGIKINI